MTIASAIENARNKIARAYQKVSDMGGTLPTTQDLENLPAAIETVTTMDPLIDGSVTEIDTDVSSIRGGAFTNCTNLNKVILRSNSLVNLSDDSILRNTPIASKTGNIYVPDSLVNNYKNLGSDNPSDFKVASQSATLGNHAWVDVTYTGSKYYAICNDGYEVSEIGYASSSSDGITWSTPIDTRVPLIDTILYDGNRYIATSDYGRIYTSSDGINFSTVAQPQAGLSWDASAYNGSVYVLINTNGDVATSSNGTSWSFKQSVIGDIYFWWGLAWGNGIFATLSRDGYLSISLDGSNWSTPVRNSNLGAKSWKRLIFNNGRFIALSSTGYISTTGYNNLNFSQAILNSNLGDRSWGALCYGDKLVALGGAGYTSYTNEKYNFLPISQLSS